MVNVVIVCTRLKPHYKISHYSPSHLLRNFPRVRLQSCMDNDYCHHLSGINFRCRGREKTTTLLGPAFSWLFYGGIKTAKTHLE